MSTLCSFSALVHRIAESYKDPYNARMLELQAQTLIVFLSDPHIGGDKGCDAFESPDEVQALFEELRGREEPVELILAGDFFDFLTISDVSQGMNRASLTMSRPEYERLFASLKRFKETEGKRVIYLPGNHDAEGWWNPEIRETLREQGLVDEFLLLCGLDTGRSWAAEPPYRGCPLCGMELIYAPRPPGISSVPKPGFRARGRMLADLSTPLPT